MSKENPKSKSVSRMIRRQPAHSKPGRRIEDPKKAYTTEQLAEVGAITLMWNQVDGFIDWLLQINLKLPPWALWNVPRQMSGMDAKLQLLRACAKESVILDDAARATIKITLDGVAEYKRFRDNIVHSVPYDIDAGIAHTLNRRAELTQMLVTVDAMKGLYQRLQLVLDELREVDLLYRLADQDSARAVYKGNDFDPLERRRTRDVPIQTAQAQRRQQLRLSLPPLPAFPD